MMAIKNYLIILTIFITSCRSIDRNIPNQISLPDKSYYNLNHYKISIIKTIVNYGKHIEDVVNIYQTSDNSNAKYNVEISYSVSNWQNYDVLAVSHVLSLGIMTIMGVPVNKVSSWASVSAEIKTKNGLTIYKTSHSSKKDAYVALYWGYDYRDAYYLASKNAINNAFKKVVMDINNIYNELPTREANIIKEQQEKLKQERIKQLKRKAEKKQQEQKRLAKLLKVFSEWETKLILEKKIALGMSEKALIESWGKPEDINTSVGSWGVHKQYVYDSQYVYVENGKVTAWQD